MTSGEVFHKSVEGVLISVELIDIHLKPFQAPFLDKPWTKTLRTEVVKEYKFIAYQICRCELLHFGKAT